MIVSLDQQELQYCQRHSEAIVKHYGGNNSRGSGTYNHNKIGGNLVGVKGEVGLSKWLRLNTALGVEDHFETYTDSAKHGDIQIGGHTIEVKSLRPHHWANYGRMIPPRQLGYYMALPGIAFSRKLTK